jgi:hypothetical protein
MPAWAKKKICETPFQWKKKLGMVAHACHPGCGRKNKIEGGS